ncbi:MAG: hypothetical protein AB7U20_18965 [Planctomycetaceae bacterium]
MDNDEHFFPSDRVRLRQRLPWLHLFRGFRIAFRGRPLLLGIVAVLLIDAGHQMIGIMPFATGTSTAGREWIDAFDESQRRSIAVDLELLSAQPIGVLQDAARHGADVVRPLWTIVRPARVLFERGHSWAQVAAAWTEVLWALLVWGVFGVAIARLAAMRFATDNSPPLRDSLRYSFSKLVSSLAAPLLPMLGVFVLWMICLAAGLFGRIPGIGPALVGVAFGLPLLLAALMTLIVLVVAAGWPLMLSSIGAEDADGFDAFSRVYSYLFSRPWYSLWLAVAALIYGSLLLTFLVTATEVLVPVSEWAVASGMGSDRVEQLLTGGGETIGVATSAVHVWRRMLGLVLVGFVTSYFWTATTIIYFLLRQSVDATALDAVSQRGIEPMTKPKDSMPLVGMAAAEQRELSGGGEMSNRE